MRKLIIFSALIIVIISGCATVNLGGRFSVFVNSISSPRANECRSFLLVPGNEGVELSDLQFQEYARYVTRALIEKGFVWANSDDEADIIIQCTYGISDPYSKKYSSIVPNFGQTGSTTSSSGYVSGNMYSGSSTTIPTYGITGLGVKSSSRTVYTRNLILTGYDYKKYKATQSIEMIWETVVQSTGRSGDLRGAFPVLVAASMPYISENTGKQIEIRIREYQKQVQFIRGIVEQPSSSSN